MTVHLRIPQIIIIVLIIGDFFPSFGISEAEGTKNKIFESNLDLRDLSSKLLRKRVTRTIRCNDNDDQVDLPIISLSSMYSVGSTVNNTSCGMSDQQRQTLLDRGFNKIVCPFGVAITGTTFFPSSYLLYMANLLSHILDADEDGIVDDPDILQYLEVTSSHGAPIMGGGNEEEEMELDTVEEGGWAYGFSSQAWKGGGNLVFIKMILVEEMFHMIHQFGYAQAYPSALGVEDFTSSVLAREMARLTCCDPGWLHGENTCRSNECGDVSLPLVGTCNEPSCDVVEFYHQVAITLVGAEPAWYAGTMPRNKEDMENMLSTEFLEMFRDPQYHQIVSSEQVNGDSYDALKD